MIRTAYYGENLEQISFPLGGIGTGSIGLAGNGRLTDWEIFNRPNKGSDNGYSHIAVKAERDGKLLDARILNGDCTTELSGRYGHGYGHGLANTTMAGFPHFKGVSFNGRYPIARLYFSDDDFPGRVQLIAFNPLIPLNDRDSGIPAAFFEVEIVNTSSDPLDYSIAMTLRNPYDGSRNEFVSFDGGAALHMTQTKLPSDDPGYGDMTLACDATEGCTYQQYWYRGGWSDHLETYWNNFTGGDFKNRVYENAGSGDHGTLCVKLKAAAGATVKVHFVISWNRPNNYNYWSPQRVKDESGKERDVTWKNYYATIFGDSLDSARYSIANYTRLYAGTLEYMRSVFDSSLPEEAIEAAASAVAVLKGPTVLRLENGEFYGWEGVNEGWGSCEGSCTHVWNYAYALCFLFPQLERSIRETDFKYNQDDSGRMSFRMTLPIGRQRGGFRACVDGQMGGVIKTYREWKLCGDDEWLRKLWPAVKKSLEYAWSDENYDKWDNDRDGVLEGRQHHTLDMELFGPSSWLEGFYLCALKAGEEMAAAMGEPKTAETYREIREKGREWSDENLFNGEYFCQKLDLTDKSRLEPFGDAVGGYWNDEAGQIKYQIGQGCEIDQLLAQWHSEICGLGDVFDREKMKTAALNLYKNNFKHSMREHFNAFRIYALNDESGAVICDYPQGKERPIIPIPYAEECMHGFEYSLAGLLITMGMIDEGMEIVRSVRDRYDGKKRNPYNEIECGSNYARSMASFALIPIFSGMSFDMPNGSLSFAPIVSRDDFMSFFSAGGAWGKFELDCTSVWCALNIKGGALTLKKLGLPFADVAEINTVEADGRSVGYKFKKGFIVFDSPITIRNKLEVIG